MVEKILRHFFKFRYSLADLIVFALIIVYLPNFWLVALATIIWGISTTLINRALHVNTDARTR